MGFDGSDPFGGIIALGSLFHTSWRPNTSVRFIGSGSEPLSTETQDAELSARSSRISKVLSGCSLPARATGWSLTSCILMAGTSVSAKVGTSPVVASDATDSPRASAHLAAGVVRGSCEGLAGNGSSNCRFRCVLDSHAAMASCTSGTHLIKSWLAFRITSNSSSGRATPSAPSLPDIASTPSWMWPRRTCDTRLIAARAVGDEPPGLASSIASGPRGARQS
mmetsp:Transcript_92200/g.282224  ORF Transcript_92200/g.282224 Transcript_92200/m.282224 type:complete len:222 (-) Transcript_92200:278-943(-)